MPENPASGRPYALPICIDLACYADIRITGNGICAEHGITMLRIFNKNNVATKTAAESTEVEKRLDIARINEVVQCFPIGKKIRYFPEFQTQLTFESIIIAYSINNELVYSQKDLHYDTVSDQNVFLIRRNGSEQQIKRITGFSIIIPDDTEENAKLDYSRKAELGRTAFRHGNNITLIASSMDKGIPQVDTTVGKTTVLKNGYYANNKVVYLDALLNSLTYIDQRQHYRFRTWIPAALNIAGDHNSISCHLFDFSDECAQIRFDEGNVLPADMADDTEAIITFQLDDAAPSITIKGNILRKNNDAIVITLDQILKEERFIKLDLIDLLAIKTNLLQHPETQQD